VCNLVFRVSATIINLINSADCYNLQESALCLLQPEPPSHVEYQARNTTAAAGTSARDFTFLVPSEYLVLLYEKVRTWGSFIIRTIKLAATFILVIVSVRRLVSKYVQLFNELVKLYMGINKPWYLPTANDGLNQKILSKWAVWH